MRLGFKDVGVRKSEIVARTQFLTKKSWQPFFIERKNQDDNLQS